MAKNIKLKKGLMIMCLATTLGIGSYQLHEQAEVNRVKGYLNDLETEDNYVDLTRVSMDYDIKSFKGKYLRKALEDSDLDYVIFADRIVYDDSHVGTFKQVLYTNDNLIGYDDFNNPVYESLNAVVNSEDGKLVYDIPLGYHLQEINITAGSAGPLRYNELDDYSMDVLSDMGAYTLSLRKH